MSDGDPGHEPAEVRLGRAREHYAHAVRIGDADAQRSAAEALEVAKRAVAAEQELPPDVRLELNRDIRALRERLARRGEEPAGTELVSQSPSLQMLSEMEVGELASAAAVTGATAHARALVVGVGRRAIHESSRVRLEALGEELARALARVDEKLARAQGAFDESQGRRRDRGVAREGSVVSDRMIQLLAALAGVAQVQLAREGLDGIFFDTTSILLGLGYVVGLGVAAAAIGRWLSPVPLRRSASAPLWLLAIAVLCSPPVFMARLTTIDLSSQYASVVNAVLVMIGLLFVALSFAIGYQGAVREHRRDAALAEDVHERERLRSLAAQREALLRTYVARGQTMRAEARRLDALFVHETLQRAPYLADEPLWLEPEEPALPRWLREACDELARADAVRAGARGVPVAEV